MKRDNIEINKSMVYGLGVVILIMAIGYFVLNQDNQVNGNVVEQINEGEIQKVVIGMKNYNYYPNTITVEVGKPVSISLDKSVSGCFRDFTIKELGIRKYLRKEDDTIEFVPSKPGTYRFACSMGMGTGTLIVK